MSMIIMNTALITGEDNICAEDKQELKHFAEGFHDGDWQIDMYWDEPEGNEQ